MSMIRVIIPAKYIVDTTVAPATDGYTVNEDWLTSDVLDWIMQHNIPSLSYDTMLCNFYLKFRDEDLALQFKLTFPP